MMKHLPKCLMQRYSLFWSKFKDKELNHELTIKTLPDGERMIWLGLPEMRKTG